MSLDSNLFLWPLVNKPVRASQSIVNETDSASFTPKIVNNQNMAFSFKRPLELKSVTKSVSENSLETSMSNKSNTEIYRRSERNFISYDFILDSKDSQDGDQSIKLEEQSDIKTVKKCKNYLNYISYRSSSKESF